MKDFFFLLALLTALCHRAGTLSAQTLDLGGTSTYAVGIGISDYQAAAIPDLRFVDRDVEAFANFRYHLFPITFTNLRHLYQTCFANENNFILPCPEL